VRVADFIFKFLADRGARHVFMVTGGGAMFLNDAVRCEKRLTPIFNQHEQASAMAAEGYVRAGNGMGVVSVTTGPGGTNTLTGVIGQWLDSVPVIYISGQVKFSTTIMSCPGIGLRQLGDQEINIIDIVRPVTKYVSAVLDAKEIKRELEKALHIAYSGRPGPVWLDIPINVQNAVADEVDMFPCDSFPDAVAGPTPEETRSVVTALKVAKRPAIIAGHGIRLAGAQREFLSLVELMNIPVLTTFNGIDLIPSDHPCFAGRIGTIGNRAGNFVLQSSDLLLSIGSRNNLRQISYNWENFGRQAKKIVVDIDPAELEKPTLRPDIAICADAGAFIAALSRETEEDNFCVSSEWQEWCHERVRRFPLTPPHLPKDNGVDVYYFMEVLSSRVPVGVPIIAGNGTACVALFQSARVKNGQRIFWNSGCASMGFDLPAALGAATGGGKAVCVAGDGSIQMNLAELQTILNHKLSVKLFILDNNGYSSIRQTQTSFFKGEKIGCDPSSGLCLPDMVKIGNAFGYRTFVADREGALPTLIDSVLEGDAPALCVVRIGENEFAPKLSSRVRPNGTIISSSLEDLYPFLTQEEIAGNMIYGKDGAG